MKQKRMHFEHQNRLKDDPSLYEIGMELVIDDLNGKSEKSNYKQNKQQKKLDK